MDGGVSVCDYSAATISGTLWTSLCTRPKHHHNTHRKFIESGSVMDRPHSGRPRSEQSEENVATVREAFDLSQGKSIRRASSELNISSTAIHRILRQESRLFSYKIQVAQKLEPHGYDSRLEIYETLLDHFRRDPSILERMWFSNEALFHLSGRVKRHHICI